MQYAAKDQNPIRAVIPMLLYLLYPDPKLYNNIRIITHSPNGGLKKY
jgi:hypothetical protein